MKSDGLVTSVDSADEEVVVSRAGREAEKTDAEELIRYSVSGISTN